MPATIGYRWIDAIEANRSVGHRSEIADQQVNIANKAAFIMWSEYPWKVYVRRIPPFWLVPGVSIYGYPYYALPTDTHSIIQASIWDGDTNTKIKELMYLRDRPEESDESFFPDVITHEPSNITNQEFRLYPPVSSSLPSSTYLVRGYYKRYFDRVDNDSITAAGIPFEHVYYSVVCKAVLWAMLDSLRDPRAGGVQINSDGNAIYTGVLGELKDMMKTMKADASLSVGNTTITPGGDAFYAYR